MEAPMKKHPVAPMAQHQTTDAGPPRSIGVSKVVETDDATPLHDTLRERVKEHVCGGPGRGRARRDCEGDAVMRWMIGRWVVIEKERGGPKIGGRGEGARKGDPRGSQAKLGSHQSEVQGEVRMRGIGVTEPGKVESRWQQQGGKKR